LREVGRELGVNHETLRNWVNAAKRAEQGGSGRGGGEQISAGEREELRRLRKKVAELESEKEVLREAAQHLPGDGSMTYRYRFISEHYARYGVARLCRVLAVKRRQGYYEWLAAQP
jgi:transposase-like protein